MKIMPKPTVTSSSAYLVTLKATIWAVIVVPMSAPRMTPMACDSDISPAVTNPTSMTVVTDEDWMTAVTNAPVISPMMRLLVSRARICFMLSPATALSASAICSIPNRNSARPPNSSIAICPAAISWPELSAANAGTHHQKRKPQASVARMGVGPVAGRVANGVDTA